MRSASSFTITRAGCVFVWITIATLMFSGCGSSGANTRGQSLRSPSRGPDQRV